MLHDNKTSDYITTSSLDFSKYASETNKTHIFVGDEYYFRVKWITRKQIYLSTNISEVSGARFGASVDFLLAVLRLLLRGESEDPGLVAISVSSCNVSAFEPVCISSAARAARSLLTQDCRECATGTDFNEDTGEDGLDDTDESGDLGSCVDFLVDGCAAFGFFDY